jgi:uncharacterized protein (TIGR00369 family)
MDAPEGYEPHFRKSPLTDPWEPIYSRRGDGRIILGLYIREAHCNSRGMVHGGLIAALADNAMGLSCGETMRERGDGDAPRLVTVSLAVDYIGAAKLGQWLAFDTAYVKAGRTLCFAQAFVTADGEVVARADARFKVV